jgi:hypothetical protein
MSLDSSFRIHGDKVSAVQCDIAERKSSLCCAGVTVSPPNRTMSLSLEEALLVLLPHITLRDQTQIAKSPYTKVRHDWEAGCIQKRWK